MSDTMHTRGPWAPVADQHGILMLGNDGGRAIMAGAIDSDERKLVCTVAAQVPYKRGTGYKAACPEREANAALIASAPDLYEALKACAVVMSGNATTKDALIVALSLARAALSRATGDA